MPLSGGAADKVGNRYERWWTADALLDVLDERATAIQIEVPGDEGRGAEFCVTQGGERVWHQVKRQTTKSGWTIATLALNGVLEWSRRTTAAGDRCVFVSTNSSGALQELAERAVNSQSFGQFREFMLEAHLCREAFDQLRKHWGDPDEEHVYTVLAHERFALRVIDENRLRSEVIRRAGSIVTGSAEAAALRLLDLAESSLHRTLYADDIWAALTADGSHARRGPEGTPVFVTAPAAAPVESWTAGAEVRIGDRTYLLCDPHVAERATPDRSAVLREARGLPTDRAATDGPGPHVWLRQVVAGAQPTGRADDARAAAEALGVERQLLDRMRSGPGVPTVVDFVAEGPVTSLVVGWPMAKGSRPCDTLADQPDPLADDPWIVANVLGGLSHLSDIVARLHRLGASHRFLTPAGVTVLADRQYGLRDLGLAGYRPSRGEGPPGHQAPEQRPQSRTTPGPATDVHQLASLTYRLLTGGLPHPTTPLPLSSAVPLVPTELAALLHSALAADPAARPEPADLAAAFRAAATGPF